jgi:kinesin family protein 11
MFVAWPYLNIHQEEKKKALEQTQEILGETSEKLKETESSLSFVQSTLVEHKVVLTEHVETEATFYSQADNVLGTLSDTVSDVTGLHAKIGRCFVVSILIFKDRQEKLHTENTESLDSFKESLLERLSETKKSVDSYVTAQTAQYASTKATISTALNKKQQVCTKPRQFVVTSSQELEALCNRVKELEGVIHACNQRLVLLHTQNLERTNIERQSIVTLNKSHSERVTGQVADLAHKTEGMDATFMLTNGNSDSCKLLTENVHAFAEKTSEKGQEGNKLISAANEITRTHTSEKSRELENSKAQFMANSTKAIASTQECREELTKFFDEQQQEMKLFQQQVLTQVSTLLSSFVAEREERIKSSLTVAQEGLTSSSAGIPSFYA